MTTDGSGGLKANYSQMGAYVNGGPAQRVPVVTTSTYAAAVVHDGTSIVSYLNGALTTTDTSVALGHVLGADPQPVDVVLTAGTQPSCLRFGGTASFAPGARFKASAAAAPAFCP